MLTLLALSALAGTEHPAERPRFRLGPALAFVGDDAEENDLGYGVQLSLHPKRWWSVAATHLVVPDMQEWRPVFEHPIEEPPDDPVATSAEAIYEAALTITPVPASFQLPRRDLPLDVYAQISAGVVYEYTSDYYKGQTEGFKPQAGLGCGLRLWPNDIFTVDLGLHDLMRMDLESTDKQRHTLVGTAALTIAVPRSSSAPDDKEAP